MHHVTAKVAMKSLLSLLPLVLLLVLLLFKGQARSSEYPETAQGVVEAFCRSDYRGDGLNSQTWPRMQRYTVWEDAPGWDRLIVVSGFKLSGQHISDKKAEIVVRYDVVATIDAGERSSEVTFVSESRQIAFQLELVNQKWKIHEPQDPPHISVEKAIQILKGEIKHQKDKSIVQNQAAVVKALQRALK